METTLYIVELGNGKLMSFDTYEKASKYLNPAYADMNPKIGILTFPTTPKWISRVCGIFTYNDLDSFHRSGMFKYLDDQLNIYN